MLVSLVQLILPLVTDFERWYYIFKDQIFPFLLLYFERNIILLKEILLSRTK